MCTKKSLLLMIILAMLIVLFSGASSFADAKYAFRFGHNQAASTYINVAAEVFVKNVAERTNGEVEIQLFPAGQLGDERSIGEAVQIGTIDMIWGDASTFGQYVPEFKGLGGGYLFRDREHLEKFIKSSLMDELTDKILKNMGVKVLSYHYSGERELTTTNKPVYHPKDLKELLIRVPQLENYMVTWEALGANVTGIAFQEVYMALKTGVADGEENPIPLIYSMKFHEVQKYLMLTGHMFQIGIYGINEKNFNNLPEEYQKIIVEEGAKMGDLAAEEVTKQTEELLPEIKKYMEIIEVDKAEWVKAAQEGGMDEWFTKQLGSELYNKIKQL